LNPWPQETWGKFNLFRWTGGFLHSFPARNAWTSNHW